jgi:hypothetical protein
VSEAIHPPYEWPTARVMETLHEIADAGEDGLPRSCVSGHMRARLRILGFAVLTLAPAAWHLTATGREALEIARVGRARWDAELLRWVADVRPAEGITERLSDIANGRD